MHICAVRTVSPKLCFYESLTRHDNHIDRTPVLFQKLVYCEETPLWMYSISEASTLLWGVNKSLFIFTEQKDKITCVKYANE